MSCIQNIPLFITVNQSKLKSVTTVLSVCLSPETKFNENSSLLYSLLVYDANDVQHRCYEDITIYPENYSKSNPVCKTIPDGYVILKVKYAGENLTPCDFEITLSK